MTQRQNRHYKDEVPENTVKRIQGILDKLNIDMTETWVDTKSAGTYALRVQVKGTEIGSNGKGVTKDLARASAYSEFMERFQNLWFARWSQLWSDSFQFRYFADEKMLSFEELSLNENVFLSMFFKSQGLAEATPEQKKAFFLKTQKLNYSMTGNKQSFLCLPFYHVNTGRVEYLPYYTYSLYYLSNGMCAGNTAEEALVQGFSEILERVVHKRILLEKPTLPDIPDSYIQKYPEIYEKYDILRQNQRYYVSLKDCSLGGAYPVAGLIIVEKNSGQYGVKLGCHPDFGIAMERAITEAAQNGDILQYSRNSHLDFENQRVMDRTNILNGFKTGMCQFPFEIFQNDGSFVEMPSVSGMSNSQLLKKLKDQLVQLGYDILIRDVSYLNYPTFQILIPNLSEVFDMDATWYNAFHTKFHLTKLINFPEQINRENIKYLISTMDFFANSQLENSMRSYSGILSNYGYPAEEYHMGWLYMTAMGCFMCGDYTSAAERLKLMISKCDEPAPFYLAVFQYMSGMSVIGSHAETMSYLKKFYDNEICEKLNTYFLDPDKVFVRQYPRYDYTNLDSSPQSNYCDYPVYRELVLKYKNAQCERTVSQYALSDLFHN